jgi:hypothetical protein
MRIPGLTAADTALLTTLAEEAISVDMLLHVPWTAVVARVAVKGVDEALATESLGFPLARLTARRVHGRIADGNRGEGAACVSV